MADQGAAADLPAGFARELSLFRSDAGECLGFISFSEFKFLDYAFFGLCFGAE